MGRREHGIVVTRRNPHRQVRYPVFPTVEIIGTRIEVAGVATSVPHPVLGSDEGSLPIVVRWIQLPYGIQALPDLY